MTDHLQRLKDALAGCYIVERELGSGGMATVYLAKDVKQHRRVAVKVLRPEFAAAVTPKGWPQAVLVTASTSDQ